METADFTKRVLRTKVKCAQIMHYCENCDHPIFPTDSYTLTVSVYGKRKNKVLVVRKEHEHPNCPYPEDEVWDELDSFSNVPELKLAA